MALTKEDIIKALEEMNLTQLNELVKEIEDHFGVVLVAKKLTLLKPLKKSLV
jgi:large subunit ribosomal protein L7/L12